ncbi:MAG: nucleotide exchange factor GrpE [Elusimicrobia bacterium]|nr:nucleotide exchange factor GrpE [Elusimicrobiota bacterium]
MGGPTPEPEPNEPPASDAAGQPEDRAASYYDQLLRLKAEFENYRKRVDRERPEWVERGRAGVLDKLLPLYDLLLQAHEQVAQLAPGEGASRDFARGLELIFKEFTKAFESEGVRPIESIGKPYDYDRHEALGFVETDAQPEGTVVEELQRGYTLKGKVLRPARVKIAKAKAPQAPAGQGAQ